MLNAALAHMHASLCMPLSLLLSFMYVSPRNCTPYCQRCGKVHINKAFGGNLAELFIWWLSIALDPHQRVLWIKDS